MRKNDKKIDDRFIMALYDKLSEAPSWMNDAHCSDIEYSGDIFNPDIMNSLCSTCPVKDKCYQWAVDNNVTSGVFGGYDFTKEDDL